jgi:hypothetical protein
MVLRGSAPLAWPRQPQRWPTQCCSACSQRSQSHGLHGDDPGKPGYLELEVGVAGDGHELAIKWLPQDNVVRHREINHLKCERLGAVLACVSKGDLQSEPREGDGLLAWDHSIEWMWGALEPVPGKP